MKLRGIRFPPILNGPGARGFFGEGYPFHRLWRCLGMTHQGVGFAAKTFSLDAYAGNLPPGPNRLTPRELFPRCIYVDFWHGHVLNAVKLSNPGYRYLLNQGYWQVMKDPFFLSFAAVSENKADRLQETREFVRILATHLPSFRSRFALQLDTSCPNLGHMIETEELNEALEILGELPRKYGIPLVPNFSASASSAQMIEIAKHPFCSALWIANAILWGFQGIDWKESSEAASRLWLEEVWAMAVIQGRQPCRMTSSELKTCAKLESKNQLSLATAFAAPVILNEGSKLALMPQLLPLLLWSALGRCAPSSEPLTTPTLGGKTRQ